MLMNQQQELSIDFIIVGENYDNEHDAPEKARTNFDETLFSIPISLNIFFMCAGSFLQQSRSLDKESNLCVITICAA